MKKTTLSALFILIGTFLLSAQTQATYTITFTSNWSQAAHPHSSGSLPANAHWSRLVGATHNDQVTFVEMGTLASDGIEDIAELGSNTVFFQEVNSAITAGDANQTINGPDLSTSLGQIVISDLVTTDNFAFLTLACMIAPSPDWMIAANSIPLQDGNGDWLNQIDLDLYAYDAGTDSGTDYTSANDDTDPAELISSLQGVIPFSDEIIGSLSITLESILEIDDIQQQGFSLYPNPSQGRLQIDHQEGIRSVVIFNALGQQVLSENGNNERRMDLNIDNLSQGIFLVRVTSESGISQTKKLVKI